jgi:hypothetical protein
MSLRFPAIGQLASVIVSGAWRPSLSQKGLDVQLSRDDMDVTRAARVRPGNPVL